MSNLLFITGYLMLILFANYLPDNNSTAAEGDYTVAVSEKSHLTIHGSTNVSRFQYKYTQAIQPEIVSVAVHQTPQGLYFSDAIVQLQARAFTCGQAQMDRDLQNLLLADQYPYITILLKKAAMPNLYGNAANSQTIQSEIEITLAGVTKKYSIPISVAENAEGYIISGKLMLDICEFGLEAPKLMMGLVTVKDNVAIKFNLVATIEAAL